MTWRYVVCKNIYGLQIGEINLKFSHKSMILLEVNAIGWEVLEDEPDELGVNEIV